MIAVAADDAQKSGVIHVEHEKISALFDRGGPIWPPTISRFRLATAQAPVRWKSTSATWNIFYILEGSATFVTGGKRKSPKRPGPGESRAKEIVGGEDRHLVKGDVIVIPNGVPHWFKEVNGTFLYYVVKVTQ